MRRSTVVKLTLLPMLAAAAVAAADPDLEPPLAPPGMAEPMLAPPGMTPTSDECQTDPSNVRCDPMYFDNDVADCIVDPYDPDYDPDCLEPAVAIVGGNVIRGGFGGYFWVSHS